MWLPTLLLLALTSCTPDREFRNLSREARRLTGGDAMRGKAAVERYGCGSCHTIPQIRTAVGDVGPPLMRMAMRTYIAGVLTNTPENMDTWIRNPPGVDPMTAMPNLNVSEEDRRDIAAFLYTLR